jgi:thiopurine S-methyltransferase
VYVKIHIKVIGNVIMTPEFWHDKWQKNEIGFHLDAPHPWLVNLFPILGFKQNQTVFVPLCGKTHDIDFLLGQGLKVVANELSEVAVKELFARLNISPEITSNVKGWDAPGKRYHSDNLSVYVGDFFKLTTELVNSKTPIEWVYDRAALVALPFEMRQQYSLHMQNLCANAQQLLMTLDYPQQQMSGPPFSVPPEEVAQHYSGYYEIESIKQQNIIGKEPRFKQKGLTEFYQRACLLKPKIQRDYL